MSAIGQVNWSQVRAALRDVVPRVTDLLRSADDPVAAALGEWNVAEVATHLSQAWELIPSLARGESASPLPDMWALADMTKAAVRSGLERDLGVIAARIEASAAEFERVLASSDPDALGPWLVEGVKVPLRLFACHLLNECLVHGYDIARANRRPWGIDRADAALVFEGFIFPLVASLAPRTLVHQGNAARLGASYDLRLRGAGRAFLVFDDGMLTIEPPSSRTVDCHISADPAALLLVSWGRRSQWAVVATGRLLAWGRRPWLGPRLNSLIRTP